MPIDAILFDLGDTLLDFEPMDTRQVFREGALRVFNGLGLRLPPTLSFDDYCDSQFRSVRWAYFWSKIAGREFDALKLMCRNHAKLGVRLDPAAQDEMMWIWYQALLDHASIANDVIPTLRELRDRGLKLGLVSNTFVPSATHDRHLRQAGLIDFLPVRVYSSEVGFRKPHRRIFEIALQRIQSLACRTLFVGDLVKADIHGAKRVGMKTALRQAFAASNHHRVADLVIRRISDLLEVLPAASRPISQGAAVT